MFWKKKKASRPGRPPSNCNLEKRRLFERFVPLGFLLSSWPVLSWQMICYELGCCFCENLYMMSIIKWMAQTVNECREHGMEVLPMFVSKNENFRPRSLAANVACERHPNGQLQTLHLAGCLVVLAQNAATAGESHPRPDQLICRHCLPPGPTSAVE